MVDGRDSVKRGQGPDRPGVLGWGVLLLLDAWISAGTERANQICMQAC